MGSAIVRRLLQLDYNFHLISNTFVSDVSPDATNHFIAALQSRRRDFHHLWFVPSTGDLYLILASDLRGT